MSKGAELSHCSTSPARLGAPGHAAPPEIPKLQPRGCQGLWGLGEGGRGCPRKAPDLLGGSQLLASSVSQATAPKFLPRLVARYKIAQIPDPADRCPGLGGFLAAPGNVGKWVPAAARLGCAPPDSHLAPQCHFPSAFGRRGKIKEGLRAADLAQGLQAGAVVLRLCRCRSEPTGQGEVPWNPTGVFLGFPGLLLPTMSPACPPPPALFDLLVQKKMLQGSGISGSSSLSATSALSKPLRASSTRGAPSPQGAQPGACQRSLGCQQEPRASHKAR